MKKNIETWNRERVTSFMGWIDSKGVETVTLNGNDFGALLRYCLRLSEAKEPSLQEELSQLKSTVEQQREQLQTLATAPGKSASMAVALMRIEEAARVALRA
ncbi:hypothetical protein EKL29_21315 [Pantoea sp. YU22]|uniref:hypothetical protein n=1 Tax=Pantoea sp. YU22 TaxID=2497684 RepID=UPI000F89105F|nr:hypothetical protein [Pantoea sp. YU22]RTY53660.1 hypothetical protein EKL29_21315 [Pantoea sp. YU22]